MKPRDYLQRLADTETRQIHSDAAFATIDAFDAMLAALKDMLVDFGPDYAGPTIDAARAAVAKAEPTS